jgi:nitrite reductase/ring-hydroxylating ferredoxin subunit
MPLNDSWFVIERSESIHSKPLGRHLLGEPIVLVRTADGDVLALEDRCPHQGVPLSQGRMGPDGLMCRYHGWSFDRRGHCTSIPGSASDHLDEIRVQSYRTLEVDGQVWITRGADTAMPAVIINADATNPSMFLWEKKCMAPASQVGVNGQPPSDGGVAQFKIHGPWGCSAQVTLCITPETSGTSRVFASAQFRSRWLPLWAARFLTLPQLRRQAHPQGLLRGVLSG